MTHDYMVSIEQLAVFWLGTVATTIGATMYLLHYIYFRPLDKPSRGRHAKKMKVMENPLKIRIPKAPRKASKPIRDHGGEPMASLTGAMQTQIMQLVPASNQATLTIPRIGRETAAIQQDKTLVHDSKQFWSRYEEIHDDFK